MWDTFIRYSLFTAYTLFPRTQEQDTFGANAFAKVLEVKTNDCLWNVRMLKIYTLELELNNNCFWSEKEALIVSQKWVSFGF